MALLGITSKGITETEIKKTEGTRPTRKKQFSCIQEMKDVKQAILDDLRLVTTPEELKATRNKHQADTERLALEDAQYVIDIARIIDGIEATFKDDIANKC